MIKRLLFLLLAAGLGAAAGARGYELDAVLRKIEARERSITKVSFDFRQSIRFEGVDAASEVEGDALFEKPNKMVITKKIPQKQVTISDGKKVWVYTPSYKQVWIGLWTDWVGGGFVPKGLVPLQDYVRELRENFDLSLGTGTGSETKEAVWIQAVPKSPDTDYTLDLLVSTDTWLPFRTTYRSQSARVETWLSEMVVNPQTKEGAFRFKPPPGTDIIRLN